MINPITTVTWQSPANIALIKYWGKKNYQLPANPSISITLSKCRTTTSVTVFTGNSNSPEVEFYFNGQNHEKFQEEVQQYINLLATDEMPFLKSFDLVIHSSNNFPHSAGISSSASFMSSLALSLCTIEKELYKNEFYDFYQRSSYIARLGSGSASRSVFGGYVNWGYTPLLLHSSDEYALPIHRNRIHELFFQYRDTILVIDSSEKAISSSEGHRLMSRHVFGAVRYKHARENHEDLLRSLLCGDEDDFVRIIENEALVLHALLMTGFPWNILLKPASLKVIQRIKKFREENHIPIGFSIDAGPNIHLLYHQRFSEEVNNFIQNELIQYCENKTIINDEIGNGPVRLS